jgi:hypothetical protein
MSAVVRPQQVRQGVYPGLSNDAYHASPGISNSGLALIDKSPRHYFAWNMDPSRPEAPERGGQLEGSLLHCALLEPDEFDKRYVLGPTLNRNTKAWKEWVEHNTKDGRYPIQGEQRDTAFAQAESARALPDVAAAVAKGQSEVSAYWNDPETGVLCRCRPDFVHEAGSGVVLIDAKTYSSADPHEFARQAARKGYHRQDTFYTDGYALASERSVLAFIFVVIEVEWPHAACAVMLDEPSRAAGRALYRRNLNTYAHCLKTNTWPGYSSAIELVSLPKYAMENNNGI